MLLIRGRRDDEGFDVILWSYNDEKQEWVEQKNIFAALSCIISTNWKDDVLITTDNVSIDNETILAVIKIIRQTRKDLFLAIGLSHPTHELSENYIKNGVSEVWAVNITSENEKKHIKLGHDTLVAGSKTLCPALHIKKGDPVELSVCGKRNNRLILVMHHFRKWCLSEYSTCPYWVDKSNEQ